MKEKLKAFLPASLQKTVSDIKNTMRSAGIQYLKAYSLIMLINFAQLFIGFIVLKVDYALLLAFAIAFIDV